MSIFILIFSILVSIVTLILVLALLMKKDYRTHSEIIINAPLQKVFDYLKQIKNQDHFNKWLMLDPDMKKEFKGTDGTVGFIYGWNGNKEGGEGEQEIKAIYEGKNIDMELRFIRPFAGVAHGRMTTESLSDNQTKVIWNTESKIKYPMNIMLPIIVNMLEKDMRTSLTTLKNIFEN